MKVTASFNNYPGAVLGGFVVSYYGMLKAGKQRTPLFSVLEIYRKESLFSRVIRAFVVPSLISVIIPENVDHIDDQM